MSNHFSLVMIVAGAMCFFAANILLKEILSPADYGKYSVVITFFSVMYLYGILGLEQIFLRYSNPAGKNFITTQKFQVSLILRTIAVTSVVGVLFFKFYFGIGIYVNIILLCLATISMVAMLYLFNIFRLNGNFVFSQFVANLWKITLFVMAAAFYVVHVTDLGLLLQLLMYGIIASSVIAFVVLMKKIKFVFDVRVGSKTIIHTGIQFFVSITCFSILLFGDRFIIERKFGVVEFGNYFYLTNFFLAPFAILQNYVGFKQLVFFKNNFSTGAFDRLNIKIMIYGCGLGLMLFLMSAIIDKTALINFSFGQYIPVILLLLVLGIVRLFSASITSAFEARTNLDSLRKANFRFIVFSALIITVAATWFDSLESIIVAIIVLWLSRSIILRQILLSQVRSETGN